MKFTKVLSALLSGYRHNQPHAGIAIARQIHEWCEEDGIDCIAAFAHKFLFEHLADSLVYLGLDEPGAIVEWAPVLALVCEWVVGDGCVSELNFGATEGRPFAVDGVLPSPRKTQCDIACRDDPRVRQ